MLPGSRVGAFLSLALLGCASVKVTPGSLRRSSAPPDVRERLAQTWEEAVRTLNDFLASPFNLSLPRGRYELHDEEGMFLVCELGRLPIAIHCSAFGDLCAFAGARAVSLGSGFIVGRRGPVEWGRAAGNNLFVRPDGTLQSSSKVAYLIAHETAHLVHGNGFWKNLGYLAEAVFLWRCRHNSVEKRPFATSRELHAFVRYQGSPEEGGRPGLPPEWAKLALALHLLSRGPGDEHGPFPELEPLSTLVPASRQVHRWEAHCGLALAWFQEARAREADAELEARLERLETAFRARALAGTLAHLVPHAAGEGAAEAAAAAVAILEEAACAAYLPRLISQARTPPPPHAPPTTRASGHTPADCGPRDPRAMPPAAGRALRP